MKRRRAFTVLALLASCALLGVFGCSGNDGPGSLFGPGSSRALVGDLSGTWEGEAGNTQAPAILVIRQDGTHLEATLTWPGNDIRTFEGEVGDPFVQFHFLTVWPPWPHGGEPDYDEWFLSVREGHLDGVALENWYGYYTGGTYDLHFRRVE